MNLIGHPVIDLQRISIANLRLNDLKEGDWRELHKSEWNAILSKHQTHKPIVNAT